MKDSWVTLGNGKKAHYQEAGFFYVLCGIGSTRIEFADHEAEKCKNCIRKIEKPYRNRINKE